CTPSAFSTASGASSRCAGSWFPAVITICSLGLARKKTGDRGVQQPLCFTRWIDAIEDIACNQEHIDTLGHNHIAQCVEKSLMFKVARPAVQSLADVPVSSVQDTHQVFLGL